jgi:hypothetical protein
MRFLLPCLLLIFTSGFVIADTNVNCSDTPSMLSRLETDGMRQGIYGIERESETEDSHVIIWFREDIETNMVTYITKTKTIFTITKTTGDITCIIANGENWISF